mmetsp:Transcript_7859/g.23213  ORF Transcript_7859/g.23213 Transcript_7859/m.23213 type:complete len:80 (-) Transcript_7859:78-317(-)
MECGSELMLVRRHQHSTTQALASVVAHVCPTLTVSQLQAPATGYSKLHNPAAATQLRHTPAQTRSRHSRPDTSPKDLTM